VSVVAASPWIAVALPALLAAACMATGSRWRSGAVWMAAAAPLTALAVAVTSLAANGSRPGPVVTLAWLGSSRLALTLGLDALGTVLLLVVGVVGTCVVVFSAGYMAEDPSPGRYFGFLALFVAAMSLLVLARDLVVLLAGWELVGACSYLLIGFWYRKPAAANAALKAFVVTHVGDAGMLLGVALLWRSAGTVSFSAPFAALPPATATAIALLLLLGAVGKSAQFPLHFWLPDAMEGPTPVSALIHAATMVAAGVYLVARLQPLFAVSATASGVVLAIGAFTALMAATIAVAQTDIKKVLAYSTISQLGFMFTALGAGAWRAAIFHLVTHASFKALLFLAAGAVIHGSGTQDLSEMGGLARKMPVTAATWLVGALALAGIPPLSGFFSKDAVLASVLRASPAAGVALLAASALTAFYITRATVLAFFGTSRGTGSAHEPGLSMTAPLAVLAAFALLLGAAAPWVATLLGGEAEALQPLVVATSVGLALASAAVAWALYARDPWRDAGAGLLGRWRTAALGGYGFDALVAVAVVRPVLRASGAAYAFADRVVIDGAVEGAGAGARWLGRLASRLQTGDAQWYVALMGLGVVAMMAVAILAGR
jgi:NADH-quinone oxidoreductase subunit L